MIIQETSVSLTYKKIDSIKKIYYTNEHILKEFFNEATVLPIPDDAPVEIPRIIAKTLHEHAQLSISPTVSTFEVKYDSGFENNWADCESYLKTRMARVIDFLNLLTNNHYEYIGIVSSLLYDDIEQSGKEKIINTLLNTENIKKIHDINVKFTFVESDNIFVNIMLQNARMFKQGIKLDEAGTLNENNQLSEPIGIILDINDRYGFNNNASYQSNCKVLDNLFACMNNIVNNKLTLLIEKGSY